VTGVMEMRPLRSAALGALCVLALFGCAASALVESEEPLTAVITEKVVPLPFDVVWPEFLSHLAAKHMYVKTVSKADGFIDTAFFMLPDEALRDYARPPASPANMTIKVRAKANIYVKKLTDQSVAVTVIPRIQVFEDRVSRFYRGGWREADSTGKFEAEILDIVRMIAESGPRAARPSGEQASPR
jgi:hypothetical protein